MEGFCMFAPRHHRTLVRFNIAFSRVNSDCWNVMRWHSTFLFHGQYILDIKNTTLYLNQDLWSTQAYKHIQVNNGSGKPSEDGEMWDHWNCWKTPFSVTTRRIVSNAELFESDTCYTLFNDNAPHSDQRWTVLIGQLFSNKLVQAAYRAANFICFYLSKHFVVLFKLLPTCQKFCLATAPRNFKYAKITFLSVFKKFCKGHFRVPRQNGVPRFPG